MAEARQSSTLDTGLQYLGTVYAKALVGAAEATGKTESVIDELESFITDVLEANPKVEAILSSPRVSFETKERILDRVLAKQMSPLLLNFLKVLVRRGRFTGVRAVRSAARQMLNDLRGRIEVQLTTAQQLDNATRDLIIAKLKASLKSEIDLKTRVDAKVLGGIVIRIGDTVYDGSLANQLARLRTELVASTTQQMRAQAERFAVAN